MGGDAAFAGQDEIDEQRGRFAGEHGFAGDGDFGDVLAAAKHFVINFF